MLHIITPDYNRSIGIAVDILVCFHFVKVNFTILVTKKSLVYESDTSGGLVKVTVSGFLFSFQIRVLPDDWFSQKEEVPYLYLSENPWACSCSLGYLRRYLDDYELNVYVRDGRIVKGDVESVVRNTDRQNK